MPATILLSNETRVRLAEYLTALQAGSERAGKRLSNTLTGRDVAKLTNTEFQDALINTKIPRIFAESEVSGDGSDWNMTELGILGDISIAVPVTIFDNGLHSHPARHAEPFAGTLVFTPGALLRSGRRQPPADWAEVTNTADTIDSEAFQRLYERKLLPVFHHMNAQASAVGKQAFITIPGLGCGQFAGPFKGQLGAALLTVLERILTTHGTSFPCIKAVYYDPVREAYLPPAPYRTWEDVVMENKLHL